MRFSYLCLLVFLLGFSGVATAQIHYLPNTDNATLRFHAQEEIHQLSIPEEALTPKGEVRTLNNCPPDILGTLFVFKGDTLTFSIDTIGLGGGSDVTLSLVDCEPIDFGTASLDSTSLTFIADSDVDGGLDTICVDFCKPGEDCETFKYSIIVKRPGQVITPAPVVLQAEAFLNEYCLDTTGLPGNLTCNYFDDCPDTYDGEGQQVYWFTQYAQPAHCFRYKASRFAGTDEVCVILCDDFTVCDTFRVSVLIQSDTLSLPFFDDFSYTGPYPSADNWLDRNAFVNNTLAKSPPSIGMATLDGLDRSGRPYLNLGSADQLTSKYIDLSNPSGSVYLKFFVAPKGFGLYPNEPDSLLLEFRSPNGEWDQIATFGGLQDDIPIDSVPAFTFQSILIDEEDYHYDGFQFRFRNYVTPVGIYDLWHIDYVYLNDQEGAGDTFDDIAFSQTPPSFLKNYTSMPWWHFETFVDEELNTAPLTSEFYNHFAETVTIADSDIVLREAINDFIFPGSDNVVDGPDANIPPKEPVTRMKTLQPSTISGYISELQSGFPGAEEIDLVMEYQLTVNSQEALFFRNDTVRYHNRFSNYFAYDDGSAERFIFFENPQAVNPMLAVKFHSNVADSLRGIQFHFPHVNGDVENQLFNIMVWIGDLNTEPAYEYIFRTPLYADSKLDTLQGFTTYRLENILDELTPVGLPADTDFYIGFQQATITNYGIPIGFDINNDYSENVLYNLGTGWNTLSLKGAPMIRPVVGAVTPIDTDVEEVQAQRVRVFPNPSTGWIQVEGADAKTYYSLFNTMGQRVLQGILHQGQIDLNRLPNGLYILNLRLEGGEIRTEKILLAR